MRMFWCVPGGALLMSLVVSAQATAQSVAVAPEGAQPVAAIVAPATAPLIVPADAGKPVPAAGLTLPAGTPVAFEFAAQLDSKTSKIDAMFPIRLIYPIAIGGSVVVPAGTMGEGQVVHAAKSGWGGKAGELVVAARYIDFNGTRIPLRRFRMGEIAVGEDRRDTAFAATALVSPLLGFLINGGEKTILIGTRANAIVSTDTLFAGAPPVTPAVSAPAPSPAAEAPVQQEGK